MKAVVIRQGGLVETVKVDSLAEAHACIEVGPEYDNVASQYKLLVTDYALQMVSNDNVNLKSKWRNYLAEDLYKIGGNGAGPEAKQVYGDVIIWNEKRRIKGRKEPFGDFTKGELFYVLSGYSGSPMCTPNSSSGCLQESADVLAKMQ
jgi:hypothetical protein